MSTEVPNPGLQRLLAAAQPLVDAGNRAGLRSLIGGIAIPVEQKAKVLCDLSYRETMAGRYRSGHAAALLAAALEFRDPDVLAALAARLRTYNEAEELRALARRAGPVARIPVPLLIAFAAQFSYLGCQEEAWRYLEEARRADPDYPPTLMACGQILTYLGRLEEAGSAFERCIARAPEIAQAHWFLSGLRKQTTAINHVARLRDRVDKAGSRSGDGLDLLHYALHKELDDIAEHAEAWRHLDLACRVKRAGLKYDTTETVALMDALIAMDVAPGMALEGPPDVTPVFVVGMHRSGTTLMEQILAGHPEVLGAGELYDFTSAMRHATDHHCQGVIDLEIVRRSAGVDFADVGQRYMDGLSWRLGDARFVVDKLPSNFLNIGFICRALPQARILHMVRDPIEVCFSNLRELFSGANPYSYDMLELADFHLQYDRLMEHWREAFPGRILDVRYDRLVSEPEAVVKEVCGFCGIDYRPEMVDIKGRKRGVATASAVQVREGITRRKVPKWKPYEAWLEPMIRRLREGGVLQTR